MLNDSFETSSTTMTFALYELALNPEIQEKMREEVNAVLKKHDNKLTYEAMLEMKYLQMVIDGENLIFFFLKNLHVIAANQTETLRKYPPVDNLLRIAANDYKIPDTNLVIEKDTLTFIPVYSIHHAPSLYPNPDKFDPERFSEENKQNRHPMAYLPFGEGPRNCIGLRFGLMQTRIGLIKLMQNFKFSPASKTMIPLGFSASAPLLSPAEDMWLKVEKL